MSRVLRARTIRLDGQCRLMLEPDAAQPARYLVRFCGLSRDRAAMAATESMRVQMMLANLRGKAPYPYPLPERVTLGWLDCRGWHLGRSPYAKPLTEMGAVQACLDELLNDIMLRVALVAAAARGGSPDLKSDAVDRGT
ncbi:MAG: hypothetical protein WCA32_17135 [Chromatiaceae bacterium]